MAGKRVNAKGDKGWRSHTQAAAPNRRLWAQDTLQETSTRCWVIDQVLKGSIQAVRRQSERAGSP